MSVNVAVVGATGAVGQEFLTVLAERNFPIKNLKLLASAKSAGKTVQFKGTDYTVEELTHDSFKDVQIALFSAGGSISKEYAPSAVKAGAVVVDNSSAFRMKDGIPLVVPEVNPEAIHKHIGIIANPNCSTIIMNVPVWPLHKVNRVKRLVVSTYQAVSGAGAWGLYELDAQVKAYAHGQPIKKEKFPHQIVNNLFSHNSKVDPANGYNEEEMKMVNETRKIFGDAEIQVTPTAVRVPVLFGHSEAVYIETKKSFDLDEVRQLLEQAQGVTVVDNLAEQEYPLAVTAEGSYDTYVGRLRRDLFHPRGLNMWVVSDNVLKGAAWNAVQIAEYMVKTR